jgi:hypothetical protein
VVESDVVARFKAFATKALLAQLYPVSGSALPKQTAYDGVRDAYTSEFGWSAELDEIEPGPARTPRWLNRLHWTVADLVQAGILEKSRGNDDLRATEMGNGLIALTAPFSDTPQTRELLSAVAATQADAAANAAADAVLVKFQARFPADRLGGMSLQDYALGGGDQDNFCWWLERGLAEVGRYSPGSSRGHIIYRQKDGRYYLPPELASLTPEQAMTEVARWHAAVVALGGGPTPEAADAEPLAKTKRSRTVKLLQSYFPERFLPINSMDHMAKLLTGFGVTAEQIPDGPVARNRLLFRLFEEVAAPHGLAPLDFARILYDRFEPKGIKLNPECVTGAKRLFRLMYGNTFDAPRFVEEERTYKAGIVARWQAVAQPEMLQLALAEGSEVAKAAELSSALLQPPSNFLNYRYQPAITGLDTQEEARIFVEAVAMLLTSGEQEDTTPDVTGFNVRMELLYGRLDAALRAPTSRTLPTLVLMLSYPDRDLVIRTDAMSRALQCLTKNSTALAAPMLTTEDYRTCRNIAEALRQDLSDLMPVDMVDVQGFIWCVFSIPDIWFGGVKYGDNDMLPRFQEARVYAVGFGAEPGVRSLVAGAAELPTDERKLRAKAIAGIAERNESVALANFIELAARPGSIVLAKATYADSRTKVSIVRVRSVACTGKSPTGYDDVLGHTIPVEWLGNADLRIKTKAFNKIAATLAAIKLADALDIIGGEEFGGTEETGSIVRLPASTPTEGKTAVLTALPLAQPALPKNLILYGPPGTGKTFRALGEMAAQFGNQKRTVSFHPGFAYEEFVEGLRPTSDGKGGPIRYEVVPGVFRQACEAARAAPDAPYLLVIDEVNRANLASVLGELITIIEEDKRGVSVTLPYSKVEFSVPGNLWIVGTMNTADRSIALMDVALRRRFIFREVGVDYAALAADFAECQDSELAGLDLSAVLRAMNERLRYLLDREHQIGHAWLFGVRSLADLRERFAGRILPLLAEYFFDDWSRACLVLGEHSTKVRPTDLITKRVIGQAEKKRLFGDSATSGSDRVLYDPGEPTTWELGHFTTICPQPSPADAESVETAA